MNKESIYNIVQIIENKKYLIFNTFSEAMITTDENYYLRYIKNCEIGEDTKQLLDMGFIVDESIDEYFRVLCNKRTVKYTGDKKINNIKIMVTSGCNARCWYCFEKNIKPKNMSNDTAEALISFLNQYADKKELHIAWFGGEPTLMKEMIKNISTALLNDGFHITTSIVTNGYLLDRDFVETLNMFGLNHIQITLDGLNEEYNRIKNYIVSDINPFETVINNISSIINYDFHISIRLNFCKNNYESILEIINYLYKRFENKIGVYVAPITGLNEDLKTIGATFLKLIDKLITCGYITKLSHIHLQSIPIFCGAEIMNVFTVTPDGYLYKCSQEVSENIPNRHVGSIFSGPQINAILKEWVDDKTPDECINCKLLPLCQQGCKGHRLGVQGLDYSCVPSKYIINEIIQKMYYLKKGQK